MSEAGVGPRLHHSPEVSDWGIPAQASLSEALEQTLSLCLPFGTSVSILCPPTTT